METARLAHETDQPACTALLRQALAHARTVRGGTALVGDATVEQLLGRWAAGGSPEAVLYVGEFHQAVVGLGAATVSVRAGSGATDRTGRIECCYVEDGARGVGVGTALMASLTAWCGEQGCLDVDALALPGDRLTKQRLEAAGFTARLLVLNRRLS
jgi:GNAT superfamily N-acetyltransferase